MKQLHCLLTYLTTSEKYLYFRLPVKICVVFKIVLFHPQYFYVCRAMVISLHVSPDYAHLTPPPSPWLLGVIIETMLVIDMMILMKMITDDDDADC